MAFLEITRSGEYYRLADPDWVSPFEGRYSMDRGARWNRPGSYPVVYLNRTKSVARLNLVKKLEDQPYSPEDLRPGFAPDLVSTELAETGCVDVVTDDGCVSAGLPRTYPIENSSLVPWAVCQSIGQDAWDEGYDGVACRSATTPITPHGEELAWFQRGDSVLVTGERVDFETWFFT